MIARARKQLREYFKGRRVAFDVPVEPAGTPFQRDVWQELTRIPYGVTHVAATGLVDKALLVWDAAAGKWKMNQQTTLTITDGGHW